MLQSGGVRLRPQAKPGSRSGLKIRQLRRRKGFEGAEKADLENQIRHVTRLEKSFPTHCESSQADFISSVYAGKCARCSVWVPGAVQCNQTQAFRGVELPRAMCEGAQSIAHHTHQVTLLRKPPCSCCNGCRKRAGGACIVCVSSYSARAWPCACHCPPRIP